MERPTFKPIGTPSDELDTPALVVDLSALESNITLVHAAVEAAGAKIRPRLDAHLCPAIGHIQVGSGGTSGVAVSTLGQAEIFGQHGFGDILVTNVMVTRPKIARTAALARRVSLVALADNSGNVDDLSKAAMSAGSTVGIAVPVRTDADAIGVTPAKASSLADHISGASNLEFAGLVSASGIDPLLEAAENCKAAGISAPMVAAGGSAKYDTNAAADGVTDILAGSYAFNDNGLARYRPELQSAARILATVISSKDEGLVWVDAGQKATSIDTGLPAVEGVEGASVPRMSAEHGALVNESGGDWDIDVGSKVWLVPDNIANTSNVYDYIQATRDGRLEAVWEVSARGRYS
jgi:D-serine deaminase-like pyridoxal phosphate-dependent protein